ncbi:MAG TPA: hypothetical protein VHK01_16910, partial [Lacipirellulaceae bacterium]|nr:hypothetical protein [Lacipirellulaceae bacterium]
MTNRHIATNGRRRISATYSALAGSCAYFLLATSALAASSAGDGALFDRLDADKNGRITSDEVAQDTRRLFERLLRRGDAD